MASRRFLKIMPGYSIILKIIPALLLVAMVLSSCGTSKNAKNNGNVSSNDNSKVSTEEGTSVDDAFIALLNSNRSKLDDVYGALQSDIPSVFFKEFEGRDIGDPNEGFRIQILSTRNVAEADSMANDFRFWAEDAFIGYIPKTYVLFQQPYYKVHVGNFQFQDSALQLNQLLKARYPDAWVVHDKVEPDLVPSDSVSFRQN